MRILCNLSVFFHGVLGGLPQAKPDGFASSLGEGAFGMAGTLTVCRKTSRLRQRPHLRGGCLRSRLGECPDGSHSEKMKKNQEWGTALLRRAHHRKEKTYGRNDFNCERSEVPL